MYRIAYPWAPRSFYSLCGGGNRFWACPLTKISAGVMSLSNITLC